MSAVITDGPQEEWWAFVRQRSLSLDFQKVRNQSQYLVIADSSLHLVNSASAQHEIYRIFTYL